jgi:dCTP deaminase
MIYSDRENKLALKREYIRIRPMPPDSAFSSMAVDLTLHAEISFWPVSQGPEGQPLVVYPHAPLFNGLELLRQHGTKLLMPPEGFILQPGAFILGWTAEEICLPFTSRIAGRVEGRSSIARLGVGIHVTAPTIHAASATRAIRITPAPASASRSGTAAHCTCVCKRG